MGDAKIILNLIEEVDPRDLETLDQIDARVWLWIEGRLFKGMYYRPRGVATEIDGFPHNTNEFPRYTRSRDALKSIRPDGYRLQSLNYCAVRKVFFIQYANDARTEILPDDRFEITNPIWSALLITEDLAEPHAIIQAIEHERRRQINAAPEDLPMTAD